jgi:hypothetical protein
LIKSWSTSGTYLSLTAKTSGLQRSNAMYANEITRISIGKATEEYLGYRLGLLESAYIACLAY